MAKEEVQVDLENSLFNIKIDEEVFRLAFPPGMIVYDFEEKKNFIAKASGERDYKAYSDAVAALARKNRAVASEVRPLHPWLLASVAVLAIVSFGLLARRYCRSNTASQGNDDVQNS